MGFSTLDDLIREIIDIHNEIASIWEKSEDYRKINLAKKCVVDVMDLRRHPEYLEYIFKYKSFLSDKVVEYSLKLGADGFESRVKTQNSIENKLSTYMKKTQNDCSDFLEGRIPIKKCLNDLFGIRYIIKEEISLELIKNHIKIQFPKLKTIVALRDGYRAIHVYFQRDNYIFPWELQIWRIEDSNLNKISHRKYKQAYTKWEKEFRKGG